MKIKVFKFKVSNYGYMESAEYKSKLGKEYRDINDELVIEGTVNNFIKDKKVIDIKTNNVEVSYHNNGHANLVELYYTIIYEEVA
jgi:hypothetical protein